MSLYLLDTHALIWAAVSPEFLSAKVRKLITQPTNEIAVSSISFWQISIKHALGKLQQVNCRPEDLLSAARTMQFDIVQATADECASFHALPRLAHKDPFDRMRIWQCLQRQATLVSKDAALRDYEPLGLRRFW